MSDLTLRQLQERTAEINQANGWWENFEDSPAQQLTELALIHSEVSEAVEEIRKGNGPETVELAWEISDVVIRVMDFAARRDIDLQAAIEDKLSANAYRGYRHGGKVI